MYYQLLTAYRVPGSATKNSQGKMEDVLLPSGTILEGRDFRQPVRKTQPDGTPKVIGYKIVQMFVMPQGYPIPPSSGTRLWPLPSDASRYRVYDASQPAQVVVAATPIPAPSEGGDDLKIVSVDTGTSTGDEAVYVAVNQLMEQILNQAATTDVPLITPRKRVMYKFVVPYEATVELVGANAKSWPVKYAVNDKVQVETVSRGMMAVIPTDGGDLFFVADGLVKEGIVVPDADTQVGFDQPAKPPVSPNGEAATPLTSDKPIEAGTSKVGLFLLAGIALFALTR